MEKEKKKKKKELSKKEEFTFKDQEASGKVTIVRLHG